MTVFRKLFRSCSDNLELMFDFSAAEWKRLSPIDKRSLDLQVH